jgi:hypothetical protein
MNDDMKQHIARIRAKVVALDIAIDPVLSESEVNDYELQYGVRLPEEYRQYLLRVGNGCVGPPAFGLDPLGSTLNDSSTKPDVDICGERNAHKAFPFTQHWIWEDGDLSREGTERDVKFGTIRLGIEDSGSDWYLVVTGPDRGIPWMIAYQGIQPVCPKRGFLQWFEDWLDGKGSFYGWPGDQSAGSPDINSKKGTKTIFNRISAVLWEKWDPLGVNSDPSTKDRYFRCAWEIYDLLTHRSFDIFIEDLLLEYETKGMGLSGSSDQHRFEVVTALREIDVTATVS